MVDKNSAPGYTIGTSKKTQFAIINGMPGPGAYENKSTIKTQRSDTKISKQKRFNNYQTLVPGPGTYTYKNSDHAPNILVKSRTKQRKEEDIPGPGSYQPDYKKLIKANSCYKIGNQKRREEIPKSILTNPGPGNYETSLSTLLQADNKALKFGPQRKIVLALDTKTPGPGSYHQNYQNGSLIVNQPKYQFGKSEKSQSSYNLSSPGPGTYISKSDFQQAIKHSKGHKMGEKYIKQQIFKGPGPGSYNETQLTKMKKSTPSFSIGKDAKLKIDNIKEHLSKPGPQAYETKTAAFTHKSFAIGKDKRKGLQTLNNMPGPGAYQIKHNQSQPNFSVSKAQRKSINEKSDTPGPGIYEPKKLYNSQYQGIGLGKDNRRTFTIKQTNPGPGEYNSYNKPLQKGGYTIGHDKRLRESKVLGPGPGNYNIPSTISNLPGYSKK